MTTITEAEALYLISIDSYTSWTKERSRDALSRFNKALLNSGLDPELTCVAELDESYINVYIAHLKGISSTTEQAYLGSVNGFYYYLASEHLAQPDLLRLKRQIALRPRKVNIRIQIPYEAIERTISYVENLVLPRNDCELNDINEKKCKTLYDLERLCVLRDRAFILFLADAGLFVTEARLLKIQDVDFNSKKLTVLDRYKKKTIVRISDRGINALIDYLRAREIDHRSQNSEVIDLPLFICHNQKTKVARQVPISRIFGRHLVRCRALEAAGDNSNLIVEANLVNPLSFRHYFVAQVLLGTHDTKTVRTLTRRSHISWERYFGGENRDMNDIYDEIFNS